MRRRRSSGSPVRWLPAMAWAVALGTVALLAGGCGCGGRSGPQADVDAAAGDAGPRDAERQDGAGLDGLPRDAGGDALLADAATCPESGWWALQARPIGSVQLVDPTPPRVGVTERFLVEVHLASSCETLASVQTSVDYSEGRLDSVKLAASAWVFSGTGCDLDAPVYTTVVTLAGRDNVGIQVVVVDGNAPNGSEPLLRYSRTDCLGSPDCECHPGSPAGPAVEGNDCLTDCSCAAGLSCVGFVPQGTTYTRWSCLRPCGGFLDCAPMEDCRPEWTLVCGWPPVCMGE